MSDSTKKVDYSEVIVSPEFAAGRVVYSAEKSAGRTHEGILPGLAGELKRQAESVQANDLQQAEAMLVNQAIALQTLFACLTEKAMAANLMENLETYLKLALRAQSQSRATLETLSQIKNPPVVYAKQANFSQGHQQVNNGVEACAHAGKIKKPPIQQSQLEENHELRTDAGASCRAGGKGSRMETVGKINRAKNS